MADVWEILPCHHESKSNYVWHCTCLFYIFSSARATFKCCGRSTSQPIAETLALFSIRSVLGWQALAYVFMRNGLISYCQHVGLLMIADRSSMVPLTLLAKLIWRDQFGSKLPWKVDWLDRDLDPHHSQPTVWLVTARFLSKQDTHFILCSIMWWRVDQAIVLLQSRTLEWLMLAMLYLSFWLKTII